MREQVTVFVVNWEFVDHSASGTIQAFLHKGAADDALRCFKAYGDPSRNYSVSEVPLLPAISIQESGDL